VCVCVCVCVCLAWCTGTDILYSDCRVTQVI